MEEKLDGNAFTEQLAQLEKLEEMQILVVHGMATKKRRRKAWFDKNLKDKDISKGDLVLLYNSRNHKGKFKFRGLSPFRVIKINNIGSLQLATLEGEEFPSFMNRSRIKGIIARGYLKVLS